MVSKRIIMHSHPRTDSPQTRPTNANLAGSSYRHGIPNPNLSGQPPLTTNYGSMIPPTNNPDIRQMRPRNFTAGPPVLMAPTTNTVEGGQTIRGNNPFYPPQFQGALPPFTYSPHLYSSYAFSSRGRNDTHAAIGQTGSRRTHDHGWGSNYGMSTPSMSSQNSMLMMPRQPHYDSLGGMIPANMHRQAPSQNTHPSYATPDFYHQAYYNNTFQSYSSAHPGYSTSLPSPHPGYTTRSAEGPSSHANPANQGLTLYPTQNYIRSLGPPHPYSVSQLPVTAATVEHGHGHPVTTPVKGNRTLGFSGPRPSIDRVVEPEVVDLDADENDVGDQNNTLDDQEQDRNDVRNDRTSSESDGTEDSGSNSDSSCNSMDLIAKRKAAVEAFIKQRGLKRLSNGEPVLKSSDDPSSDNKCVLQIYRVKEGSWSTDSEAERESDANFMKKLKSADFFESGGLVFEPIWESEKEIKPPEQCGASIQPHSDPEENVNTSCLYEDRIEIPDNDEARNHMPTITSSRSTEMIMDRGNMGAPDCGFTMYPINDNVVFMSEVGPQLANPDPMIAGSMEPVVIEHEALEHHAGMKTEAEMTIAPDNLERRAGLKKEAEMTIAPEALEIELSNVKVETSAISAVVDIEMPILKPETTNLEETAGVEVETAFKALKLDPEMSVTPETVELTEETTPAATQIGMSFTSVKMEPGMPLTAVKTEPGLTELSFTAVKTEPEMIDQTVFDNGDECPSFGSFKGSIGSTSVEVPEYMSGDDQYDESSYSRSPPSQTVDENVIERQRYQREMVRRNVLSDPKGPGPYLLLGMLRKYTIPQRLPNLAQSEMIVFGLSHLAVGFQEALYRKLDISNGINLHSTGDIEKFMANYDPGTSKIKYLIYLMDCESDETFDIKQFLRHSKLLKPLIFPSQKVDFLICK
ncbi:unnamed protein product, partial [Orchesella dallaii]